jgi:hypothetical protein
MQRNHWDQAAHNRRGSHNDGECEPNPNHVHRKPEKDLRYSSPRTKSADFEDCVQRG